MLIGKTCQFAYKTFKITSYFERKLSKLNSIISQRKRKQFDVRFLDLKLVKHLTYFIMNRHCGVAIFRPSSPIFSKNFTIGEAGEKLNYCHVKQSPRRPPKIAQPSVFHDVQRDIGKSFQLAITTTRINLIVYGNATAQC